MPSRRSPRRLLRAAVRRALPSRMAAAYSEHREGVPARQVLWRYLSGFPEFSLLTRTRHGWMTYSNKDWAIGRRLFIEGQFEYGVIDRVVALLRDLGLPTGGLLVDVGANIGTVTVTLLRKGIFRRAVAVEPIPENCRRLTRNLFLNGLRQRVQVMQAAVGRESATVTMTLSPSNHGDHRIRSGVSLRSDEMAESTWPTIAVRCERLDDIVTERPDLLWMDVQGFDLRVLEGAPRLLSSGVPVVMEFAPYWIAQAGIAIEEFCESFSARVGTFYDLGASVPVRAPADDIAALFKTYHGLDYGDLLLLPP